MPWIAWIVLALVSIVGIVALVGSRLPVAHSVTRTATIPLAPDALSAMLAEVDRYPAWRTDVTRIERRADRDGRPAWIEHTSSGRIPLVFERLEPPSLLVARIDDRSLPFGGTWTYRIAPAGGGSSLSITEDGEVYNVFFRFLSRFVFGHAATIDTFLKHVRAAAPQDARR